MNAAEFIKQYHLRLDPQQEAAIQCVDGPVLLLAVPGSGKTTVLVSRIGYMLYAKGISPRKILTMTYTVSAARDMRQRFSTFFGEQDAPFLEFRTINGICSRIIHFYERSMNRTAFRLLTDGKQKSMIIGDLYRSQNRGEYATESTIKAIETAITYAKNQMLTEEELGTVEVEGVDFAPLFQKYCKALRAQKLMDFDDQMVYALQILRQYPEILRSIQARYQYFCVDEAQDTSKIQHSIIRLIAGKSQNLFMVGDEDQSIYGFRAAYPEALTQFKKVYPNARVLYMEQNYRSAGKIVAAADRFIQKNQNRHPKHMKATRPNGAEVREISVADRRSQYRYLAKLAKNCKRETAVLYRDNDSALPLIDLMDRSGVPYRCRQVDSIFFTNRIVRDISDIIHLAENPCDGERFMNVYYKMGAGISKEAARIAVTHCEREQLTILETIASLSSVSAWTKRQCLSLQAHLSKLLHERADKAIYRIVHFMGYGAYLDDRGIDHSKTDILEALGADQPNPLALLRRLETLEDVVRAGSSDKTAPFLLSTIHSSKGLEYEEVILIDILDGILPQVTLPHPDRATADEKETYEEERRLFYVGMTRAKQQLSIVSFQSSSLHSSFSSELFDKPKEKAAPAPVKVHTFDRGFSKQNAAGAISEELYHVGTKLIHKKYGSGVISSQNGDIVTVCFADGSDKKFSLSAALRMKQFKLS